MARQITKRLVDAVTLDGTTTKTGVIRTACMKNICITVMPNATADMTLKVYTSNESSSTDKPIADTSDSFVETAFFTISDGQLNDGSTGFVPTASTTERLRINADDMVYTYVEATVTAGAADLLITGITPEVS